MKVPMLKFEELKDLHKLHSSPLSEKQKLELEKHLKEMKIPTIRPEQMKELERIHISPMTEKQRLEMEKALKEMHSGKIKEMRALELEKMSETQRKALTESMAKIKEIRPEEMRKLRSMGEIERMKVMEGMKPLEMLRTPGLTFTADKIEKLMDSLTADQKRLHESQGYLKFSQLNEEQRKLVGSGGDGNFTISFSVKGRSITIKNEK
jgi:hypothetical protein